MLNYSVAELRFMTICEMVWNWVTNLAKFCELYIITEGEFRDKIEEVVPTLEQGKNMHFYFLI